MENNSENAQRAIELIQKAESQEEVYKAFYISELVSDPSTQVLDADGRKCEFCELWRELYGDKQCYLP